jgi:L-lysine exporter family protein LysE/ArgO
MDHPVLAAAQGFLLGASLIVAIGAQNAYVLRQGIVKHHVGPLVAFCAAADFALIMLGVAGVGTLIQSNSTLLAVATWGGAAFLAWYGATALQRALRPEALRAAEVTNETLRGALTKVAAFTFLNPHVYLDTVVLVGALSGTFESPANWTFGLGAALASAIWFAILGYGARLLAPIFARPAAWRVLDLIIAGIMFTIAGGLVASRFS